MILVKVGMHSPPAQEAEGTKPQPAPQQEKKQPTPKSNR